MPAVPKPGGLPARLRRAACTLAPWRVVSTVVDSSRAGGSDAVIVRSVGGVLWLFDQRDHSALCGEMAAVWGAAPFAPVPPAVVRAAAMHDAGWTEWDARPRLDPRTGRPHPYSRMPDDDYLAIWRRGVARAWAEGEETGLLVSLHGMRFFARRTRPTDRAFYEQQRRRQSEALRRLGAGGFDVDALPEPFATWHAWMFFWDGLSLFVCEGWDSPWLARVPSARNTRTEIRVERVDGGAAPGGAVMLEPFPFLEPLALATSARRIADRRYATQAELDAAVAGAEARTVRWTLRAA